MLQRAQDDGGGILVVVDGVFSMEGDIAPLPEICDLCERYGARLMVDEAHGAGVLGARGAGTAELLGVGDRVDLRMGTFSKSLASCGGFVAGTSEVIEYLRLYSRAFLFTASAVPAAVGAALAALRVVRSDGWPAAAGARARERPPAARRPAGARLRRRRPAGAARRRPRAATRSRPARRARRIAGAQTIVTPIVPVLVGDDWKAALLWRALYDAGVFVNTALHPAVPPGGALLRTSVMATHDEATLARALEVFARVKREFEAEHGPLPGPAEHSSPAESRRARRASPSALVQIFTSAGRQKKVASSVRSARTLLTDRAVAHSLRERSARRSGSPPNCHRWNTFSGRSRGPGGRFRTS